MLDRRRFLQATAALSGGALIGAMPAPARASEALAMRVIQSGHSLTDPIVPMLARIVAATGAPEARRGRIDRSTVPGSPMDWRWTHRNEYMTDARHDIAGYDMLVITERTPLSNTLPWHDSEEMALTWATHAWTEGRGGAGAATVLYATWVATTSGPEAGNPYKDPEGLIPFRDRLPLEMARWQAIADHANAGRPSGAPAIRVVPGPLVMAAVHDAIAAGSAPGLERIEALFSDEIHLNAQGAYLIALAHLAVIYGLDPRDTPDLPAALDMPAPATAAWMKALVHEVLAAYPDAGYPATATQG